MALCCVGVGVVTIVDGKLSVGVSSVRIIDAAAGLWRLAVG
jgi:hypothetical protein